MKQTIYKYLLYTSSCCVILFADSCKKQDDFLNAKPNEALTVPSSLSDLQSMLQNENIFSTNDPALGEIASDDFYIPTPIWSSSTPNEANSYIWAKQIYNAGASVTDWNTPYQQVYYANTILDALPKMKIDISQKTQFDQIKGAALFYRAIAFYNLLQTFSLPYDSASSDKQLGIPIRLSSDLNLPSVRANQKDCYDQILQDLQATVNLLPVTPVYKTLPSQPAANGLLARTYLVMGNYTKAYQYADACLSQYSTLVDYNTLTPTSTAITNTNAYLAEDILHRRMVSYSLVSTNYQSIADSTLYKSYASDDLRRGLFFILNGVLPYFRGSYDYKGLTYCGIATDEIYLIRAECNARAGNTVNAMNDLNSVLLKRWKTGTFVPYTALSPVEALSKILIERRKELLYRGTRWIDLRRLNKDAQFAITLTKSVNGNTYTLAPNDSRYVFPIPDNEIATSGIQQNDR